MEMAIPTLTTARLILRPIENGDVDGFTRIWSDPEFARHVGGPVTSPDAVWHQMAGCIGCWLLTGVGPWSVVERESGTLVGRAGLWDEPGWPGVEALWYIGRPWWGRGYAAEAAAAAITWVLRVRPELDRVCAAIVPANIRSVRVAQRLGMHRTGAEYLHEETHAIYAVSRADWSRRSGAGS
ncbi:acetyltransferase, ribosomal protein N-acetylase [Frankia torreyi]|uniref:Acetyltransferase, ribosomal protein N-acetylase n=2 Tax=Frankiaceae TaxID=74712 RepID=A0A0D8BDS0_9ACTN|nr:acetyltransferase, ribosomal protein N-acetylase [Frankia torreyi]